MGNAVAAVVASAIRAAEGQPAAAVVDAVRRLARQFTDEAKQSNQQLIEVSTVMHATYSVKLVAPIASAAVLLLLMMVMLALTVSVVAQAAAQDLRGRIEAALRAKKEEGHEEGGGQPQPRKRKFSIITISMSSTITGSVARDMLTRLVTLPSASKLTDGPTDAYCCPYFSGAASLLHTASYGFDALPD